MTWYIKLLEGLFSAIVVGVFLMWMYARVRKKTFWELYNETMDKITGTQSEPINIKNPLKGKIVPNKAGADRIIR